MRTEDYVNPAQRSLAKKGPVHPPKTTDELYEVFIKELREGASDSTRWVFYGTNRAAAQMAAVAFMQRFTEITAIDILYNHERLDQYRRRGPDDHPDTAPWWHIDLLRTKEAEA